MAYNNLAELFKAIADAIRGKTGGADPIVANDFPTAIEGISGGEADHSMEDGLISGTITEYRNDRVESVADYAFYNNATLERITLPNVKTIAERAICSVEKLKILELGNVTSAASDTIMNCSELEYVVLRAETVGMDKYDFRNIKCKLLVPRSLKDGFASAMLDIAQTTGSTITVLALEDYTVDGTITGELDLTKMGL